MIGILTVVWDAEAGKFKVGHIGNFIGYKGEEFLDYEPVYYTNKSLKEIHDFLTSEGSEPVSEDSEG